MTNNHPANWKSGQYTDNFGYIKILMPEHPRASKDGYIKRSVMILEKKLGRHMMLGTNCHHINGIKTDDRPENLIELSRSNHVALHNKIRIVTHRPKERCCSQGHEYTSENTYSFFSRGCPARRCRTCAREYDKRRRDKYRKRVYLPRIKCAESAR